jgi:hypothetical protein
MCFFTYLRIIASVLRVINEVDRDRWLELTEVDGSGLWAVSEGWG